MNIGVRLPQYASSWPQLRAAAQLAERLGFHGLWLNDHLQTPGRLKKAPAFDALTTLAALAPLTGRARLGVSVLSASYRAPALAAKMTTILDVISGGRLTVGLGTGSDRAEHAAYGFPFASPAERTATLRRALAVMQAMGEQPEGADVPGLLEDAPNLPAAAQRPHPPVWLAAHRPALLRLAGQRADGVIGAFVSPGEYARRRQIAEEAREEAGRGPLAYALYTYAMPIPSQQEAEDWLRPEADALESTPGKLLRWLRTTGLVGEPAELRDALGACAEAGVTDTVLVLPSRVPAEALEALAEAVLERPGGPSAARAPSRPGRANLVHGLVEEHCRAGRAESPAAVDEDGRWTFAELGAASARAAGTLGECGVRRGERVAILLPDGRRWCQAFLGAARLGAVAIPLDPASPPERLAEILADCEPALVVSEDGQTADGWPSLPARELENGRPAPIAAVHPDDLAYLIYSSGSTGRPKAAMHAHGDLRVGIEGYGRQVLGLAAGDRCHSVARCFTSLGFGNGFFRVLGCGATAVFSRLRPTPRAVLGLIGREQVSVLTAVPTFWAQLATFLERHPDPEALAPLRLGVSSGDSLPASIYEQVRGMGLELLEGLGCSECSNVVLSTRIGEPLPGTLGRAVPGVEIELRDEGGRPVESGSPGRLWIRSDSNTTGYWRRRESTRELVLGPWLRMGDVLREEEGVHRFQGRADELFKVDARWVSPPEVEAVLLEHPTVSEAAVVGLPDERGLMRPGAFVVLAAGASSEGLLNELRRHVAHRLEPHKAPTALTVLDSLPLLPSGKVDRRALRSGVAPGLGAQP